MKKKTMKNKEFKRIDIERLVYKVGAISNAILWIPILLNATLWHSHFLSGITTGWNLCLCLMLIVVGIAGHKNFKYEMEQFKWLMTQYDMDGDENNGEISSGGEQDTTNRDK